MPRTSRIPLLLPIAAILVMVGVGACFNFDTAYTSYCDATGRCDGGNGGGGHDGGNDGGPTGNDGGNDGGQTGNDGGSDGGQTGNDGGSTDGGRDGGTTPCLNFGATCSAYGQCCDPEDGGAAQPMGCSRFNYCQPRPRECQEDAYKCAKDSDCCSGHCNSGTCSACADGNTGAACGQAVDCCVFYGSVCNPTGHCESSFGASADGYRCPSADFCTSGYCELVADGGTTPPDGVCKTPANGCKTLGSAVSGSQTCCPGMIAATPPSGTSNVCCLPEGAYCDRNQSSCCSGNCLGGRCVPNSDFGNLGHRCVNSNECGGQLLCDPVSRTCTGRWCMQTGAYPGCCSFSAWNGTCRFPDGRTCQNPGASCTQATASQCCSGTCDSTNHCDTIIFF